MRRTVHRICYGRLETRVDGFESALEILDFLVARIDFVFERSDLHGTVVSKNNHDKPHGPTHFDFVSPDFLKQVLPAFVLIRPILLRIRIISS